MARVSGVEDHRYQTCLILYSTEQHRADEGPDGLPKGAPKAMSTATWEHTDHKAGPDAGPGRSDNPARIPGSILVVDSDPKAVSKCDIPARIPRSFPVADSEPKTVSFSQPQ